MSVRQIVPSEPISAVTATHVIKLLPWLVLINDDASSMMLSSLDSGDVT